MDAACTSILPFGFSSTWLGALVVGVFLRASVPSIDFIYVKASFALHSLQLSSFFWPLTNPLLPFSFASLSLWLSFFSLPLWLSSYFNLWADGGSFSLSSCFWGSFFRLCVPSASFSISSLRQFSLHTARSCLPCTSLSLVSSDLRLHFIPLARSVVCFIGSLLSATGSISRASSRICGAAAIIVWLIISLSAGGQDPPSFACADRGLAFRLALAQLRLSFFCHLVTLPFAASTLGFSSSSEMRVTGLVRVDIAVLVHCCMVSSVALCASFVSPRRRLSPRWSCVEVALVARLSHPSYALLCPVNGFMLSRLNSRSKTFILGMLPPMVTVCFIPFSLSGKFIHLLHLPWITFNFQSAFLNISAP